MKFLLRYLKYIKHKKINVIFLFLLLVSIVISLPFLVITQTASTIKEYFNKK